MGIFDFLKDIPLSALLREKLKDIEAEVSRLKDANAKLSQEIAERDAKIANLTRQLQPSPVLDEVAIRVLQALSQHAPNAEFDEGVVASGAGVGLQAAVYHLEVLGKHRFVDAHHYAGMPSMGVEASNQWTLGHLGREYLIKRGLLN